MVIGEERMNGKIRTHTRLGLHSLHTYIHTYVRTYIHTYIHHIGYYVLAYIHICLHAYTETGISNRFMKKKQTDYIEN
jgi:hypothetical protein